jgi:hypothetical protein
MLQGQGTGDPYAVLGVSRTVNADELKRAYRKLSMAWHPDRHAGASEAHQQEAARRFKLINAAYVAIGEILRSTPAAGASGQDAVVQQSDARVEAIRAVVNSAALRVAPNLPRPAYLRVTAVVEQLLVDTIAVGERAFVLGFEGALRDAMLMIGMDAILRADALKVLDAAVDDLQWRGRGADPHTWQTLLRPLERARGRADDPPRALGAGHARRPQRFDWEALLRPEPALVVCQGALAILVILLLLPLVPLTSTARGIALFCDLLVLGYLTFGLRST